MTTNDGEAVHRIGMDSNSALLPSVFNAMKKRKNKPGAGRPSEGRERIQLCIKPETVAKIRSGMNGNLNTLGKVVDAKFTD